MLRRPIVLTAVALVALLSSSTAFAQGGRARRAESKPAAVISGPKTAGVPALVAPFAPVERLDYTVEWNNMATAAQLSLVVAERGRFFDRDALRIVCEAKTIGFARLAASLDARIESYVDPGTLLPFRAVRESTIQGRTQTQTLVFDRQKRTVTGAHGPSEIGAETGDTLTMLYRFRALVPKVGQTITLDGFEGDRRLEMRATVETTEKISTPAGTYEAVRVAFVPMNNGSPDDQNQIRAWFTTDKARMPVLFTAEPRFGPIRVALASATLPSGSGR
jgi:hypothetical protein